MSEPAERGAGARWGRWYWLACGECGGLFPTRVGRRRGVVPRCRECRQQKDAPAAVAEPVEPAATSDGYAAPRTQDLGWMDRANCLGCDPELFFPERGESVKEARAVCAGCVVRTECLEFALAIGEKQGIWGGLSERERRRLRKARRQVGASA